MPSIAEAHFHRSFDRNAWLLLPETDIVEKFHKSLENIGQARVTAIRKQFPDLPVSLLIIPNFEFLNWVILGGANFFL
jgi:hypothetical protein